MKNPRDKSQIMHLATQMYPRNSRFFIDAYNDATEKPYSYIKLDLTPNTPDKFRLSTRLTPEEFDNFNISPIYYQPCRET